eukprot:1160244-Pelagomonas_calceolata.AAC.2
MQSVPAFPLCAAQQSCTRSHIRTRQLRLQAMINCCCCTHAGSKIMATIGPSIHDTDILAKLLEAGMAAGRVDLTWGECKAVSSSLQGEGMS